MKTLRHLQSMLPALAGLLVTLAGALGLYCAIWGWDRFKLDFWPLDSSRVGPNLCASLVLVVLLIAHNEFVVVERAKKLHEDHRQATEDVLRELFHPTEEAEASIAAQVETQWRQQVLTQLDETTPGGIGTIATTLEELKPKQTSPKPTRRTTPKRAS